MASQAILLHAKHSARAAMAQADCSSKIGLGGCSLQHNPGLALKGRATAHAGHANMSAVLCTYTAGYFLWTIYTRHRSSVFDAFDERKGWWHFLWKDFCHALAMYWILLMVSLAPSRLWIDAALGWCPGCIFLNLTGCL